jgi:hypothetical protein
VQSVVPVDSVALGNGDSGFRAYRGLAVLDGCTSVRNASGVTADPGAVYVAHSTVTGNDIGVFGINVLSQ